MKFVINVKTLLTELTFLSGIVSTKSNAIPVLQNIAIVSENNSTLKLSTSDLDVSLSCRTEAAVSEQGAILVSLSKLYDITKTLPKAADMTFQPLKNGSGAKVTCERASFDLRAPDFDAFPELPKRPKNAIELPSEIFKSMITSTIFAITLDESRYTLSGAKVEIDKTGIKMVTTDGHRLAKTESKEITAKTPIDVLIPRKALAELAKLCSAHEGTITIATDSNHIHFEVGSRSLSARLLVGQFPNYDMVIPKSSPNAFTTDLTALREAVKRVALMADEKARTIRLDIKKDELSISASNSDDGEALETIPIQLDGEETSIGFNSDYLLDVYNSLTDQELITMQFKDSNSQIILLPGTPLPTQPLNVIMPCRL